MLRRSSADVAAIGYRRTTTDVYEVLFVLSENWWGVVELVNLVRPPRSALVGWASGPVG